MPGEEHLGDAIQRMLGCIDVEIPTHMSEYRKSDKLLTPLPRPEHHRVPCEWYIKINKHSMLPQSMQNRMVSEFFAPEKVISLLNPLALC